MKIAVCISGQPRNFKKSYTSLKSNFLDKYNCDIFFHSWKTSNFESTNFGGGNHQYNLSEKNYKELVNLYKPKNYILEQPITFDDSGYKCPIWRQPLNNTLSMYYSIYKSFQLVKSNYDYIIRTRFDLNYNDLNLAFPKEGITLQEWNTDIRVKHRGYYDAFAIGKQQDMITYSKVFCNVISYISNDQNYLKFLQGGWPGQDSPLRNEYLLKWHLLKNNIKVNELTTNNKSAAVGIIR